MILKATTKQEQNKVIVIKIKGLKVLMSNTTGYVIRPEVFKCLVINDDPLLWQFFL